MIRRPSPTAWVALGALLPCLPLLALHRNFYYDWSNHVWLIGYFGRYFREHLSMPVVIHTRTLTGMPLPIFYGTLFYPLLGIFASLVSGDLVIRTAVLGVLLLQSFLVYTAFRRIAPASLACGVALLADWAIYPLTNLYNRAAITEFFGVAFLTAGLAACFLAAGEGRKTRQAYWIQLSALLLVLACGTHPITAAYGAVFLGGIGLFLLRDLRGALSLGSALLALLIGALVLSPWLYAVHGMGAFLDIVKSPHLTYWPESIDSLRVRLSPIPLDLRTHGVAIEQVSTPYLDAQLNLPLLLLDLGLIALILKNKTRLSTRMAAGACFSLLLGIAWLVLSVSELGNRVLPGFLRAAQFAYRMVTYQNLSLLALAYFSLRLLSEAPPRPVIFSKRFVALLAAVLTLSGASVLLKFRHAWRMAFYDPGIHVLRTTEDRLIEPPDGKFYGWYDYGTPGLLGPPVEMTGVPEIRFNTGTGVDFGILQPVRFQMPQAGWVSVEASAFAWNGLDLDGQTVPFSSIAQTRDEILGIRLPAGVHRLEYSFNPDPVWTRLHALSLPLLLLWIGLIAAGGVWPAGPGCQKAEE